MAGSKDLVNARSDNLAMCFLKETEIDFSGNASGFRRAVSVYVNKPHVVNRRLVGSKTLYLRWHSDWSDVESLKTKFSIADDLLNEGETTLTEEESMLDVDLESYDDGVVIIVRDLIPRQIDKYPTLRELVSYDTQRETVTFHPVCHVQTVPPHKHLIEEDAFCFTFKHGNPARIQLSIASRPKEEEETGHVTSRWLSDVLLKKIARWGEEEKLRTETLSLRLVAVDEYNRLYNDLKVKYGHHFVEIWPERTDPKKFVYEDVAIATYLLLLWGADRARKGTSRLQSFVDLGCGNGLLVHILSAEGHPGVGLDIRKRKIWELFGPGTTLKEQSVIPSAESLFPEYDWLIGNHSDELTPWIPMMAARSSYSCCYFVLPCCLYDFDSKFSVREKGCSPYRTYLNWVREVGEVCGYQVEEDTLRIPSTKRVCFVGRCRTYPETSEKEQDEKRSLYVQGRCSKKEDNSDCPKDMKRPRLDNGVAWAEKFEPRSNIEPVRNCQKVAKDTKETIVHKVFDRVLNCPNGEIASLGNGKQWRKGGALALSEVAGMFDSDILQQLKAESGGVQTLLRNHNNVFQVTGGLVRLRDFTLKNPWGQAKSKSRSKGGNPSYFKTSLCWFHQNHPDGCPRESDNCKFAHGSEDIREKVME